MDYKNLLRKLDRNLSHIERSEDLLATLSAILRRLVDDFRDDLGLLGGRIYVRRGGSYVLQKEYPTRKAPPGFRIPVSYRPIRELLEHGYVLHDISDPGVDRTIEKALGVKVFAAIGVGDRARQMMAFTLQAGSDPEHVLMTLGTIRHVINSKVREEELADRVAEVRAIQLSLLPRQVPAFEPYDLWGATVPAEEVGGDLYDFLPISERSLGIAVADASGHGLPAALQARDAIIGLRMGVEEKMRITATVEKLNQVVHRSALASRFISMFYGEVERNGNFVYVNAGHAPPMLLHDTSLVELSQGGLVLGPRHDAQYERGYAHLAPGAVLLAYTDGISEAENARGEAFGVERLRTILRGRPWTSARELVETVFREVRAFAGPGADLPLDDQTVVALIRKRAPVTPEGGTPPRSPR